MIINTYDSNSYIDLALTKAKLKLIRIDPFYFCLY